MQIAFWVLPIVLKFKLLENMPIKVQLNQL